MQPSSRNFDTLTKLYATASQSKVVALTMRTSQERLSVRLMAAVMASPAKPALTGSSTDTSRAVPNTTMLLMKSILMASHLFMICRQHSGVGKSCDAAGNVGDETHA